MGTFPAAGEALPSPNIQQQPFPTCLKIACLVLATQSSFNVPFGHNSQQVRLAVTRVSSYKRSGCHEKGDQGYEGLLCGGAGGFASVSIHKPVVQGCHDMRGRLQVFRHHTGGTCRYVSLFLYKENCS